LRNLPEPETVAIDSLSQDGRGVARIDGKTVFVDGALPGESVRVQRTRKHRRYDEARVVEVLAPAADRVEPRCAHYGTCGGCSLQHLEGERQLEAKRLQVAEQFRRLGGVEPAQWLAPVRGPVWHYRRRARLGVKFVKRKGKVLVGFRERSAPFIADVERCEVLAEPVGSLVGALARLFDGLSIRDRLPQVEVAVAEQVTALVLRVLDPPSGEDLAQLRGFAAAQGVKFYLQPGGLETVAPLDPPAARLAYRLPAFDVEIRFEPTDFIQVNAALNEKAVSHAIALLSPGPGETVLDLFCGLGNFTLPLARRAARVVGVEGDAALVARARDNAEVNGIGNAEFHAADLAADPRGAAWAAGSFDRVLLDPPRAGAAAVLPLVAASGARRVVYVSCHPGSLARDAGELVREHGFRFTSAGVMDMFPHTAHVESIAVFEAA